jgi:hypothetical protein
MESRFNIPAPAVVKLGSDVSAEMVRRLKVAVCPATSNAEQFRETSTSTMMFEFQEIATALEVAGQGRGGLG